MEIYVKQCSNCTLMPLTSFEELSPTWTGEKILMYFGEGMARYQYEVVGMTSLFGGSPCTISITKVEAPEGERGYLVHGGDNGVRILDEGAEPIPGVDDHLPLGYGKAVVWIDEADLADLPEEVQAIVSQSL